MTDPLNRQQIQAMLCAWNDMEFDSEAKEGVLRHLHELEYQINTTKGDEYSENADVTRNFKQAGEFLAHADAIDACALYMHKHWCSITNWIKTREVLSDEALLGRITDLRLYAALLYVLAVEMEEVDDATL